jgi:hypothetical protein
MKKNESKQPLISLSLAGAIGYYMHNKLVKAGVSPNGNVDSAADDRTKDELSWRPEPVVETPEIEPIIENEPLLVEPAEMPFADTQESEEEQLKLDVVLCESCGGANDVNDDVCSFCGNSLQITEDTEDTEDAFVVADSIVEEEEPIVDEAVAEEPVIEGVAVEEPTVEEPAVIEFPTLNFTDLNLDAVQNNNDVAEDPAGENAVDESISPVEEDTSIAKQNDDEVEVKDISDDDKDTTVEDLFDAVNDEKPSDQTVMDNVEPLHKVDNKEASSKEEFKSIMDFFNTL